MTQKLSDQINLYFDLMEKIREQLYRVLPVSDRYLCIVSFNTQLQALQCVLVNKESLMEAKLLEGLTGAELTLYGQYLQTAEQWVASGMQLDYPFIQNADVYAEYRSLAHSEAASSVEYEMETPGDIEQTQSNINYATRAQLLDFIEKTKLAPKKRANLMEDDDLRDLIFDHFGVPEDEEDEEDEEDLDDVDDDEEDEEDLDDVDDDEEDEEEDETDGFETTREYIESLSKSAALAKVSTYGIPHLFSLADAWGFEKSTDVALMQSLAKGHILRTFL